MDRKGFIRRILGIAGVAIVAPGILGRDKFDCVLCEDSGEVTIFKEYERDGITLKLDPRRVPCLNCERGKYLQTQLQDQVDRGWPRPVNETERSVIQGSGGWINPDEWQAHQIYMENRKKDLYKFLKTFKG